MVILPLTACEQSSQQAQIEEPGMAQPVESTTMADSEETEMPEMFDMSGKFADMFISEVTDTFDPGLQIGDRFPAISALHKGEEIMTIDRFIRDRGAIFIAARSVDW